jgi:hypothetical protein
MTRRDFRAAIEEARALLAEHRGEGAARAETLPALPLPSLLEQCRALLTETAEAAPEPLRTVHHFACTGGTLICRCLAAMPNVRLLSEVDPLSTLEQGGKAGFFPSDLPSLARAGSRPPGQAVQVEMFLAGLAVLAEDSRRHGLDLVLRDHAHSHFCTGPEIAERPTLREILAPAHGLRSVVTVRHPFDSWLGLLEWGWPHFSPGTVEEYARRYHAFLDRHAGLEVLRYEDFLEDAEGQLQRLCALLGLGYDPGFRALLPAIRLSGDSGRRGDRIGPRPRRRHPPEMAEAALASVWFTSLMDRLGYRM